MHGFRTSPARWHPVLNPQGLAYLDHRVLQVLVDQLHALHGGGGDEAVAHVLRALERGVVLGDVLVSELSVCVWRGGGPKKGVRQGLGLFFGARKGVGGLVQWWATELRGAPSSGWLSAMESGSACALDSRNRCKKGEKRKVARNRCVRGRPALNVRHPHCTAFSCPAGAPATTHLWQSPPERLMHLDFHLHRQALHSTEQPSASAITPQHTTHRHSVGCAAHRQQHPALPGAGAPATARLGGRPAASWRTCGSRPSGCPEFLQGGCGGLREVAASSCQFSHRCVSGKLAAWAWAALDGMQGLAHGAPSLGVCDATARSACKRACMLTADTVHVGRQASPCAWHAVEGAAARCSALRVRAGARTHNARTLREVQGVRLGVKHDLLGGEARQHQPRLLGLDLRGSSKRAKGGGAGEGGWCTERRGGGPANAAAGGMPCKGRSTCLAFLAGRAGGAHTGGAGGASRPSASHEPRARCRRGHFHSSIPNPWNPGQRSSQCTALLPPKPHSERPGGPTSRSRTAVSPICRPRPDTTRLKPCCLRNWRMRSSAAAASVL